MNILLSGRLVLQNEQLNNAEEKKQIDKLIINATAEKTRREPALEWPFII